MIKTALLADDDPELTGSKQNKRIINSLAEPHL